MTLPSTTRTSPIFQDGKLKPGIYKIQNLYSETYLDIHRHSKQVCCRPAGDLEEGKGLWEIKNLGAGYSVKVVEPGMPDQFCNPTEGLANGVALFVNAYPAAWRIEIIDETVHHGFEYVWFFWGPSKRTWDLAGGYKVNGTKVQFYNEGGYAWQRWRLIPVNVGGISAPSLSSSVIPGSGSLPPYDVDETGKSSTRTQHSANSENDDEFGTVITEVTTVVTTTRRKYRVEDA
ncbi:hypothetical protein BJ322DRAFT_1111696 [Thelephora terrestris]|uniref:Ricin B lectin domain-containing protein n=1 Tax=Thelephora terrestris TaxID=56493 RepID=A0A9P6L449_9AGAM|nr:hypothetical protein BJ322DRAFT_1111696 [Thelephora terrestris]